MRQATRDKIHNSKSELRQDLVSGDWIVIAPGRSKRPDQFIRKGIKRKKAPRKGCPFENLQKNDNNEPFLIYPNKHSWAIQVIQNKYPAVQHLGEKCESAYKHGLFQVMPGFGHHDIIITRDHNKNFPDLDKEHANLVFQAMRDRYLMLYNDKCLEYISIFQNWGPNAGASVFHPHFQLIAIPVVPPDVTHSLRGSKEYFDKHKQCTHCLMIEWEKKEGKRVIYENDGAIAFAPYVSRVPFEARVFPKKHLSFFENTYDHDITSVVDALQKTLKLIHKNLNDPDYNFFIHTAPLKNKENYKHYHWHIEILPKLAIYAGFELGTGVEINQADPDVAAKTLRQP